MSSSVSSECVFSQGGITITRLRSCLKGDIVEALQGLKCVIHHDLLFRKPAPLSALEGTETADQEAAVGGESSEESDIEDTSWDGFIIDDQDLDDEAMYESNYDYN
jgi:hypothetical protein